ncbi:DUF1772 domain-containing protein [Actinomadura barringtoniae]|uniref:DUF1772 domain-containing protein n=1 Tax=Actinomadura barringtoniae TaxID=1427535 RepID=A0A939PUM9_9ACTN|nr:anthrone oxygenase family protein [Actinomadura barringtoniae]MBO2455086.1 DUF1772 domain-containing protein [Actinomadura barringtoniae]
MNALQTGSPRQTTRLTNAVLVAAILTTGLVTGVEFLYATTIMPGLHDLDDKTFVAAFQAIDKAIMNPFFMGSFFGAVVLTAVAAFQHRGPALRGALPWLIAAAVLYFLGVAITMAVNVPLNDALKAAGDPGHIANIAKVRHDFHESRWVAWNIVRTLLSLASFGILSWVAVAYRARRTAA